MPNRGLVELAWRVSVWQAFFVGMVCVVGWGGGGGIGQKRVLMQ
ncbi:hypothetical protein [Bacillus sp. THAF10]|nr:hypothetical protein [Bacillus sp. THAF10]